jgi:hypothetical protein
MNLDLKGGVTIGRCVRSVYPANVAIVALATTKGVDGAVVALLEGAGRIIGWARESVHGGADELRVQGLLFAHGGRSCAVSDVER